MFLTVSWFTLDVAEFELHFLAWCKGDCHALLLATGRSRCVFASTAQRTCWRHVLGTPPRRDVAFEGLLSRSGHSYWTFCPREIQLGACYTRVEAPQYRLVKLSIATASNERIRYVKTYLAAADMFNLLYRTDMRWPY